MLASAAPTRIPLPFANAGTKNTIPTTPGATPGLAALSTGFPPLTFQPIASGGIPPAGADFNGILFAITAVTQWQCAGGGFKYDATFSTAVGGYPKGAILNGLNNDVQWISTVDNNTTDPDGVSPTGWVPLDTFGITAITGLTNANVTLTAIQASRPVITLAGVLTGNVQIIFPVGQAPVVVANNTTGAFTVTCKTAAGTGSAVTQGGAERYYGDGTDLKPQLISTQAPGTNNQTPASTAFVTAAVAAGAAPVIVPRRQTILSAAAGAFLSTTSGLTVNALGGTTPLRLAFPAGMGSSGAIDYVGVINTNAASFWTGLTANVINYLFVDRNTGTGVLTGVASTLPCIAQVSGVAPSIVSGQHTYLYDVGEMYVGNGATATQVQRVAVGEVTAGASTITALRPYRIMGMAQVYNALTPSTSQMTTAHDIGFPPKVRTASIDVLSGQTDVNYVYGDQYDMANLTDASNGAVIGYTVDRINAYVISNTGTICVKNKTAASTTSITAAKWRSAFYLDRGF